MRLHSKESMDGNSLMFCGIEYKVLQLVLLIEMYCGELFVTVISAVDSFILAHMLSVDLPAALSIRL